MDFNICFMNESMNECRGDAISNKVKSKAMAPAISVIT